MNLESTKFGTPWPSKLHQNWDFWYENVPSGNPASISKFIASPFLSLKTIRVLQLQSFYTMNSTMMSVETCRTLSG
jgi:hypothetical protein